MKTLVIGRIYKNKQSKELFRIFRSGGAGYYSGRGYNRMGFIPSNYIRAKDMKNCSIKEINYFLEQEMKNGAARTWNK